MSAAELPGLPGRRLGGKLAKAPQGTRRWRLPIGLVYDAAGPVVLDPEEAMQAAVRHVFAGLATRQAAWAVVKPFGAHRLPIPDRLWHRASQGEGVWRPLRHARRLSMLPTPFYAGA